MLLLLLLFFVLFVGATVIVAPVVLPHAPQDFTWTGFLSVVVVVVVLSC